MSVIVRLMFPWATSPEFLGCTTWYMDTGKAHFQVVSSTRPPLKASGHGLRTSRDNSRDLAECMAHLSRIIGAHRISRLAAGRNPSQKSAVRHIKVREKLIPRFLRLFLSWCPFQDDVHLRSCQLRPRVLSPRAWRSVVAGTLQYPLLSQPSARWARWHLPPEALSGAPVYQTPSNVQASGRQNATGDARTQYKVYRS
jgi:hypothetical protein